MLLCKGFETLLSSVGDRPMELWSKHVSLDGKIKRIPDKLLNGDKVIEIIGKTEGSVSKDTISTYISCPADSTTFLETKLPILVLIIKNLKLEGKIEFQVIDQMDFRRRFILITNSTREKIPKVTPTSAFLPFNLEEDWNMLEIDLRKLTKEIYSTGFLMLNRLIIFPNFQIRRIYLQDRHYEKYEKPKDFFEAIMDLYDIRKKSIRSSDKNCQTQASKMISVVPKVIKKKRIKKKSEISK